jgi:hypothetical protein
MERALVPSILTILSTLPSAGIGAPYGPLGEPPRNQKNNRQNFFHSHLLKQGHPRNHFLPAIRGAWQE